MAERIVPPLVAEVGIELCRVKLEGGLLGGYMCEVITENLSEREKNIYKCPRCEGIMKDCSITKGEQLCACCIREEEESHSNVPIRTTILSLKCSCPLTKRGCDWIGTLVNVETHLAVCQYVYVSCILMCGIVLRGEMIIHVREECTQREEACLHCSRIRKVCEMAEHVKVCGKVVLMCELGCGIRVRREDTLYHRQKECSEETVMCPYVKYRCEVVELKRKELRQHLEENRLLHTELKLNTMEEQTEMKLRVSEKQTEMKLQVLVEQTEINLKVLEKSEMKIKVLEEQTEIKLYELINNNQVLQKQIDRLENRLLTKDREIDFLSDEYRLKQEGIVKWNIKNILKIFKPNLRKSIFGSNFSQEFTIAMYPFHLLHDTSSEYFSISLRPSRSSNHDNLDWPLKVRAITRVICHRDDRDAMEFTTPTMEIQKGDCGILSSKPIGIFSIPLSTDLEDFIKSDCLDLEVRIRILKNTTFQSI